MRRDARDGRALLHRSIAHCKLGRFEGESPPALPQPREAEPDWRWACCVRRQTPWRTQTRRCGSMAAVPRHTIDEGAISPSLCATATHTRTHNIPLSDPSPTLWRAHRVGCFQLGDYAAASASLTEAARLQPTRAIKMWMRKANAELDGSTPSSPCPATFPGPLR